MAIDPVADLLVAASGAFTQAVAAYGDADRLEIRAAPGSDPERIFDLASLTKVLDTTTRALRLLADRDLDIPIQESLPEFIHARVSWRHLLSHDSGLPAHREYWALGLDPVRAWARVLMEPLLNEPGGETVYSCVGFMILRAALARLEDPNSGPEDWVRWAQEPALPELRVLGCDFKYPPVHGAAPTEDGLSGRTHDENSRFFGGTAGNAGLFGRAWDVGRFAQMVLRGGEGVVDGTALSKWTRRQRPGSTRALGWDTKSAEGSSAGQRFGPQSFGHTGFVGTSLWIDPDRGYFAALLTNRVALGRSNDAHIALRPAFADAAWAALSAR